MKRSGFFILVFTIFLFAIPASQAASAPVASFISTTPQSGTFILPMNFTDTSANTPTSWVWTCKNLTPGNNTEVVFSTAQNPTFTFDVGNWSIKLKVSNAAGSSSTPGTFFVKVRTLQNIQVFPKDYIWNVRVDTLPVDSRSNTYINKMLENTQANNYVEPQWGRRIRNEPNIFESPSEVTYYNLGTSRIVRTPIPHEPLYTENTNRGDYNCIADGDDCHAYIIDKTNMLAYELYHVNRNPGNNTYTAKNVVVWNLSDYKLISPGTPTVDEGGMSMLPGYIYYDEVATDSVSHATRFATQFTNGDTGSNVWPAIQANSFYHGSSYPGLGQRFRLKSSFDTSGYPNQARIILESWKKYGLILADNSLPNHSWDVFGFGDPRWDPIALDALRNVKVSDFEAVDVSSLMIDENSGQARTISSVPETPSKTSISFITAEDNRQNFLNVENIDLRDRLKSKVPSSENQTIAVKTLVIPQSSTNHEMIFKFINFPFLFYKTCREFLYRFI